jgi:hypothetical protein
MLDNARLPSRNFKMLYLSKSDFKVARTCAAKLYFTELEYPSSNDSNEYMAFLANGGYMVETIAKLLHPDGFEIGFESGPEESFRQTMAALSSENVTLFEATLIFKGRIARVDILEKHGRFFRLIEVKAKSVDTAIGGNPFRGKKGDIVSKWQAYLEDVTFQTIVLEKLFPEHQIEPVLRLVDKNRTTTIDSVHSQFRLERAKKDKESNQRPTVAFVGNVEELRHSNFLVDFNVSDEVNVLRAEVEDACLSFVSSLTPLQRIDGKKGAKCRDCEFRLEPTNSDDRSGFRECWGGLADVKPHILDYYKVGTIGGRGAPLISAAIAEGRASLFDIEESQLVKKDGNIGPDARRQQIQRQYTFENKEYLDPALPRVLATHEYPLHFIDFETSAVAVPYHAGMKPYELVAFQWSCHSISKANEPFTHTEWINVDDVFPSFAFAKALMAQIGLNGTVYIWSPHELTTLKRIREQIERYGVDEPILRNWLDQTLSNQGAHFVDLCALAKEHYFHPLMAGRVSIKIVLPAIWRTNHSLRDYQPFRRYLAQDADGNILSPYDSLPALPFPDSELEESSEEVVSDGTGAMRAYQELLYGLSKDDEVRKIQWKQLLLQYCELDTAAMIMIWRHWLG